MKITFFKISAVIICALFLTGGAARAVEISLDKTGSSGGNTQSLNIGFVDIEKIFNEHPMTSRLKTEFEDKVKEYELI